MNMLILCASLISPFEVMRDHSVIRLTDRLLVQMTPMHRARGGAAAVTLIDALFVVGGSEYLKLGSRGGEFYLPARDKWHNLPEMAHRRFQCTVKTYEKVVYCVGGAEDGSSLNTMERLDPRMPGWVQVIAPWSHSLGLCLKACEFQDPLYLN